MQIGGAVMAWVRIDDCFPDHPKVIAAGPMAGWLYVCALAYANRFLTDGFIPAQQVKRLTDCDDPDALAQALVNVGLWEAVEDGYQIHDYLEYQPSAEKVKAEREAARMRMANRRSDEVRPNFARTSEEVQLPQPVPNPVPVPNPRPGQKENGYTKDFEMFWLNYPRKTAKAEAFRVWQKIKPGPELVAVMCRALTWQRDEWEPKYTPHAATYLNQRRWEDERPVRSVKETGPVPFDPAKFQRIRATGGAR